MACIGQDEARSGAVLPVDEILRRRLVRSVFQPVYRVSDGELTGYEALARVGPGSGGSPTAWLAAAEREGLRTEFELLCLEVAGEAGDPPSGASLFVNLSSTTLSDPRFGELRTRLASDLVIDLTEDDAFDRNGAGAVDTGALRSNGVRVAIADVSASSLLDLARLRPAFVKLGRDLIAHIDTDQARQSLVDAIARFGHDVGFNVVAEKVERTEELQVLADAGVELVQGYLLGAPAEGWQAGSIPPDRISPADSEHGLGSRLRAARDAGAACDVVTSLVQRRGVSASVYLVRGGLLRCQSHRGHAEVFDGIPLSTGILGRAMRNRQREIVTDVAGDPDRLTESSRLEMLVAEPLPVDGEVVGCLVVESEDELDSEELARIHRCACLLAGRLEAVGIEGNHAALARLARASKELMGLSDRRDVERASVRVATQVAGMSTAALVLPAQDALELVSVVGPMADEIRSVMPGAAVQIAEQLGLVSSCFTDPEASDVETSGLGALRSAGLTTVAALPVRLLGDESGLLVVADKAAIRFDTERIEALELLADELARGLDLAGLVDELRERAIRDPVTGLRNQRAFDEIVKAFGGRRAHRWTLMMADIDGFKPVNDTHGHQTGDRLLTDLAVAMEETLRPLDQLFRVGGDEFAVVLPDLEESVALEVGERLCSAALSVLGDYGASLSVGIALPVEGEEPSEFVHRADITLYQAKRARPGSARISRS